MAFTGVFPANKLQPAPYGLFSVADVARHNGRDDHWAGGFQQETEACNFQASIIDVCGGTAPVSSLDSSTADRYFDVAPFGITAKDECLSPGWNVVDRKARVIRQLDLITERAVEKELWGGAFKQADTSSTTGMFLASSDATVVDATAQKVKVGLAALEQAFAECSTGFRGTIHMTPLVASMIGIDMRQVGDCLETANGNAIAIGAGYDGTGPAGATPAGAQYIHWMYATGPVFVHLGVEELVTVNPAQATNATTNDMTWVAERPASVHWDGCCHLAIPVDVRL